MVLGWQTELIITVQRWGKNSKTGPKISSKLQKGSKNDWNPGIFGKGMKKGFSAGAKEDGCRAAPELPPPRWRVLCVSCCLSAGAEIQAPPPAVILGHRTIIQFLPISGTHRELTAVGPWTSSHRHKAHFYKNDPPPLPPKNVDRSWKLTSMTDRCAKAKCRWFIVETSELPKQFPPSRIPMGRSATQSPISEHQLETVFLSLGERSAWWWIIRWGTALKSGRAFSLAPRGSVSVVRLYHRRRTPLSGEPRLFN